MPIRRAPYRNLIESAGDAARRHASRPRNDVRRCARRDLAILRPTLIYGAGDPHNGYGPNRFRRLAATGKPIILFGEGEERRDHVTHRRCGRARRAGHLPPLDRRSQHRHGRRRIVSRHRAHGGWFVRPSGCRHPAAHVRAPCLTTAIGPSISQPAAPPFRILSTRPWKMGSSRRSATKRGRSLSERPGDLYVRV